MEYFLLLPALLYLGYCLYCFNFLRKEPLLKPHEKAYWLFLSFAFPFLSIIVYRNLRQRQRSRRRISPNP